MLGTCVSGSLGTRTRLEDRRVMASRIAHTPHDVHESLQTILNDEQTFLKVVDTVFGNMDANNNGLLDAEELAGFMVRKPCAYISMPTVDWAPYGNPELGPTKWIISG